MQKQHYISRFYLNYFSPINKPGMIWVYTNNKPQLRSIKKHVANIENFYTINTSSGESNVIENEFSKLETQAGRVIKKLNSHNFDLTQDELNTILVFMSYLRARTPAERDSINDPVSLERKLILKMLAHHENLFNKKMGEVLSEMKEEDRFSFEEYKEYISNNIEKLDLSMNQIESAQTMVVAATELQRMFELMKWNFLIAPSNFFYLTSDRPVFPYMNNWKMPYLPGFGYRNVEVYFPVTPSICMMGMYSDLSIARHINGDMVNVINSRIKYNSYQYVYANMDEKDLLTQSNTTFNKINSVKTK